MGFFWVWKFQVVKKKKGEGVSVDFTPLVIDDFRGRAHFHFKATEPTLSEDISAVMWLA